VCAALLLFRIRCAKSITSPADIQCLRHFGQQTYAALVEDVFCLLMATPKGVGQPRSACTMFAQRRLKVLTAPGQPPAVAMHPTARPLK